MLDDSSKLSHWVRGPALVLPHYIPIGAVVLLGVGCLVEIVSNLDQGSFFLPRTIPRENIVMNFP